MKQKKHIKIFFCLIVVLFGVLGPTLTVSATDFTEDQISFTMDTQVPDATGANFSNGNFIKLVAGHDLLVNATLTLTAPGNGLNFKGDTLTFSGKSVQISDIGVELRQVSDPSNANSGAGTTVAQSHFLGATSLKANQAQTFTFDLNSLSSLNLSDSKFGSNTPNFLVVPVLKLNDTRFWNEVKSSAVALALLPVGGVAGLYVYNKVFFDSNNNEAFFAPQKRVYVKIYPDQATANAAATPTDVQGYGGVTGNLQAPSQTPGLASLINQIIGTILAIIQFAIYGIFAYLIAPIIVAVLSIHTYQDSFVAVIYSGWETVRNICDIFFVVALIIIAMATLFRVESYKARHLLVQLIIAALLINFSLVIGQAVLAVADTVQAQFLPANVVSVNNLAIRLMTTNNSSISAWFQTPGLLNSNGTTATAQAVNGSLFGGILASLIWLALSLGTFFVFCAIAAFLVIRIVALWLLLMISPVAYAVGVLPSTSHYRDEWWKNFLKYAFFTPIMAFFLNMAAIMVNNAQNNPVLAQAAKDAGLFGSNSIGPLVVTIGSNVLLLVFLIAALKVADLAGIYGAQGITDLAKKGIFAPFAGAGWLGKKAGNRVGRFWNETTSKLRGDPNQRVTLGRAIAFAALNPVAFVKGMGKQAEEREHRATAKAEAVGQEVAEQRFSNLISPKAFIVGSYKINPHVLQHAKGEEDEQQKKLANLSLQEVAKRAYEIALMPDDEEGRAYKRGVIKLAMSKGHIDDITENMHTTKEGRMMMEKVDAMIAKGDFEAQDFYQMTETSPGHWEYTNTDSDTGVVSVVGKDKRMAITQNDIGRRAMYVAMFGGAMHKGTDAKTGEATLDFELADHEAARLITQEGEVEGLAVGHLEYMDMMYDTGKGEYEAHKLRKIQEKIWDQATGTMKSTGRMIWINDGGKNKQAVEIAKRNPREQLAHMSPHALMSSDGKSYNLSVWEKVSSGIAESPTHVPDRLVDRLVAGWLPADQINDIRKQMQESHSTITAAAPDPSKPAGGYTAAIPAVIEIKLKRDDKLRLKAFAAKNKRGAAGLLQKFMKTDGQLQNILVDGKYKIKVIDIDPNTGVPTGAPPEELDLKG